MAPLPNKPRLRASFSFDSDGRLLVELTLMSHGRELVHRAAPFVTDALLTLAAHRHLLGLVAADGVRAGIFDMPEVPPPVEPSDEQQVERLVLEQAQSIGLISSVEASNAVERLAPSAAAHAQPGAVLSATDEEAAALKRRAAARELEPQDDTERTEQVGEVAAAEAHPGAVLSAADEEAAALKRRAAARELEPQDNDAETSGPETPRDGATAPKEP